MMGAAPGGALSRTMLYPCMNYRHMLSALCSVNTIIEANTVIGFTILEYE